TVALGKPCNLAARTRVVVPETAVYEDHFAKLWEYQVWLARQLFRVQTVTVSHTEYGLADYKFRLRVFATYTPHVFAATLSANGVHLRIQILRHCAPLGNW